jgi:hypothetical protein
MDFRDEFDRIAREEARTAAARNIFSEVDDWRGTRRSVASKRWIWELLQNAKDCAKRKPFTFSLVVKGATLTVQHDAGHFTLREIVALVEGDSSKHRRAEDTTGRFGKGFLVSHVVSTNVQVRGILADEKKGKFSFAFRLRRDGSEGEIRRNIEKCRDALEDAQPYSATSYPTEFIYHLTADEETDSCIKDAVRDLQNHAPFLFSFIPELSQIIFEVRGEHRLVFATERRDQLPAPNLAAAVEKIGVSTPGGTRSVLLFTLANSPKTAQPQIAFELDSQNRVIIRSLVARVFQDLPLHGTAEFDIPIVLNLPAACDVDSDRSVPNITKADTRKTIYSAFSLLPSVAKWAISEHTRGVHLLAEFGISEEMRRESQSAELWEKSISETVRALSACKIVECRDGFLPVDEVVFPDATWLENVPPDAALLRGVQRLLSTRGDNVPGEETVEEWQSILAKWKTVSGAPSGRRTGLSALYSELQNAQSMSTLRKKHSVFRNDEDAVAYLCDLFQVAAEYCERQKIDAPAGLKDLPVLLNQNRQFREGRNLRVDGGVDSVLKDISSQLDLNFKEKLVDVTLSESPGGKLISQLCGNNTFSAENAVAALVTDIERRFSAGQTRGPEGQTLSNAATTLLAWLAGHPSCEISDLQSFPLLCADGKLHAVTDYHEMLIAPTDLLNEDDRNIVDLFPESVRLSDQHLRTCEAQKVPPKLLDGFLEQHGLASASLIVQRDWGSDAEHFSTMYRDKSESGHKVERLSVTDVVGLTRLLSDTAGASSSGDPAKAERVLSFILSYAAMQDDSWKSTVTATCVRNHGCAGFVTLFPCFWLAKLKDIAWVPSTEVGGPCEPLSLRTIGMWEKLPSEVCESQDARDFLALHFGVDRLEMAIRASAGDDQRRRTELRDELAEVVNIGIEPNELRDLIIRHRSMVEINTRNGKLGRIVETLVRQVFEKENFDVERTGTGSDFKVRLAEAKDLEWDKQDVGELRLIATYHGIPVEFFVEIKATQGDVVRMSWRQAEAATANPAAYILCVVDFSDHADLFDRVLQDDEPTCEIISGCIGLVPTIGQDLTIAVQNLSSAVETDNPAIEIEKADEIRFRIGRRVWLEGNKLSDWANSAKEAVARAQPSK